MTDRLRAVLDDIEALCDLTETEARHAETVALITNIRALIDSADDWQVLAW